MGAFIGFLIMFLVAELLLLAVSIGISYLLRLVIPSLDQGMAILISLVATIASALMVAKLVSSASDNTIIISEDEEDEDEDGDEDDGDDERDLQGRRSRGGVYSFDRFPRRKGRKRRR